MEQNKSELIALCNAWLDKRLDGLKQAQSAVDESLQGAVKSSAGDKHNTERAHLQLQAEKLGQQFKAIDQQRLALSKIQSGVATGKVHLGSLVETDQQRYFIAIAAGAIQFKGNQIWAIAPQSPIGQLLLGKSVGESIVWAGKSQQITKIY